MKTRIVDLLQYYLAILIVLLFVTGGYRGKIELSQVDVFAWVFLAIGLGRWWTQGSFLGEPLAAHVKKLHRYVSANPTFVLFALVITYVMVFTVTGALRYLAFQTNAYDMGFVDQAIWATAHLPGERLLHSSLSKGGTYFGEHFAPLFLLIAPFYRIYPAIYWLFFIQSVLLGLGAVLIYRIALGRGYSTAMGVLFGALLLIYQPVRSANLFDLREDVFYIPILLGAFLAMESRRWALFWSIALLGFGVKENAPIAMFLFGLYLMVRRQFKHGTVLCVLSAAAFLILNIYVVPSFAGKGGTTVLSGTMSALGSTNEEVFGRFMSSPFESMAILLGLKFDVQSAKYFFYIFLPFLLFIPLKKWRETSVLGIALLLYVMNVFIGPKTLGFHYELIIVPFVFVALIYGLKSRFEQWGKWNVVSLVVTLFFCVGGRGPLLSARQYFPNEDKRCLNKVLAQIPKDASVATQSSLHPHLDHRKVAVLFTSADALNEDLLITSSLPGLTYYGTGKAEQELNRVDQERYPSVVENRIVHIRCRKEYCDQRPELQREITALLKQGC